MWQIECWSPGDILGERYKYNTLEDGTEVLRYQTQEDIDSRLFDIESALARLENEKDFLQRHNDYLMTREN